jgi:hypothetical protein
MNRIMNMKMVLCDRISEHVHVNVQYMNIDIDIYTDMDTDIIVI